MEKLQTPTKTYRDKVTQARRDRNEAEWTHLCDKLDNGVIAHYSCADLRKLIAEKLRVAS